MHHTSRSLLWVVVAATVLLCGCIPAPRGPRLVSDPDPSNKIPAIKASVQRKDMSAVKQLVKDLQSDDPAVRFYAIEGLHRLTGETFGYRYYEDETARQPAVEKWQVWLAGWASGAGEKQP